MRRISNNAPKGLSRQAIRIWGLLFLLAGVVGQGILMNVILGMKGQSNDQIMAALNSNEQNVTYVVFALLSQMAYACAIPIYTFLLVDGFRRTSRIRDYALRLAGVALLAEIPYNLAMSGKWIDFGTRNPMVAMVLGVGMMYFFNFYSGKKIKNILIRVLVVVLGYIWANMLRIEHGVPIVIMVCILWALRKRRGFQILIGCAMMFTIGAIPGIGTPMYWLAPIVFLVINFYNDEQGDENRWFNYLSYPMMLLIVGLIAKYGM
jgi:hypothetical protein